MLEYSLFFYQFFKKNKKFYYYISLTFVKNDNKCFDMFFLWCYYLTINYGEIDGSCLVQLTIKYTKEKNNKTKEVLLWMLKKNL